MVDEFSNILQARAVEMNSSLTVGSPPTTLEASKAEVEVLHQEKTRFGRHAGIVSVGRVDELISFSQCALTVRFLQFIPSSLKRVSGERPGGSHVSEEHDRSVKTKPMFNDNNI